MTLAIYIYESYSVKPRKLLGGVAVLAHKHTNAQNAPSPKGRSPLSPAARLDPAPLAETNT